MTDRFEDKVKVYKHKSPKHLQNWKKIRALDNFAKAHPDIKIFEELEMVMRFYLKGWLWESQEKLLDDLLEHYKVDYTKWAVKDNWIKGLISRVSIKGNHDKQLEFWFPELEREQIDAREKMSIYSKLERHKLIEPRMSA